MNASLSAVSDGSLGRSEPIEQQLDLRRYLSVIRRRWPYFLIPAVVIFVAAVALAYKLPRLYEATATILVESQQIPTDLASPTVTANTAERIQIIQQRLMARDNLLEIASKFGLYSDQGKLLPSEVVDRMRDAARIAQIDVGSQVMGRDGGVLGFTVSFAYVNPTIASQVANEFVTSILSQNLQTRLSRAEETSNFFKQQLSTLESDLSAMEARLAEFKRKNEDALPETMPYRRTLLLQLSGEIAGIENKIRLAGLPAGAAGDIGPERVRQLNRRLDAKQLELKSLVEDRDDLKPLAEKGFVTEKRIRELDRAIAAVELDLDGIKSDIDIEKGGGGEGVVQNLEAQRTILEQKAAALNESILRTPQVEGELNALTREYGNLQDEYRQAKAKLADATTGERLEEDRQSERFEVIEQATVPEKPIKPDRRRIILAGSIGGLAAGFGVVVLLELLFRSIRTVADLERALQLHPLATIPFVTVPAEIRRRRWFLIGAVLLSVLAVAVGLLLIHWYYLPLDLVLEKLTQRLGIGWLN